MYAIRSYYDEESGDSEDEEPLEKEQWNTEDIKAEEKEEFEFDEIEESEVGIEEPELDELVYEDISEGESFDESKIRITSYNVCYTKLLR